METLQWSAGSTMALLAFLAIFSTLLLPRLISSRRRRNFPPGPKSWPIIGNLNLLGPFPHRNLHDLSQKYGNLMQLKFGSYPVVVASSPEMAKLFLNTYDQNFASRPPSAAGKYTGYNSSNLTWAPSGPYWQKGRKLFLRELFNSKSLESYKYIRVEEMQAYMSSNFALSGKPVVVKDHLSYFMLSVISRTVLGSNYFVESFEEFQWMLGELFLLNGVFNVGDWIPWMEFLDLQGYVKRMKALNKRFDRFFDFVIAEHRARKEMVEVDEFVAIDMVDVLLPMCDGPKDPDQVKLHLDGVKGFLQDLIGGGTDTPTAVVEWAMSEVMKHPNLIKNATEELDRVVGLERWVQERDIPQLHYIDAIIKETMRLHPVAVMISNHLALEDCKVAGYDIRKGTRVFVNTWSISRDPNLWVDPEVFCPERFLAREINIKGRSFELMPFGSGRRKCPGYSLALKMIYLSLANLLHGFHWRLPDNMVIDDLGMEEFHGLATTRKFPLIAVMEPRLGRHNYNL